MPANLSAPFSPSCCDGGASNNDSSAQPCGCDSGEGWVCQTHKDMAYKLSQEANNGVVVDSFRYYNPLDIHLKEVVNVSWNFAKRCLTHKDHVMNAASGLAGESGEVLDVIKKSYYHEPKDRRKELVSELGDLFFYVSKLMELEGVTLEECLEDNRLKLESRHPEFGKVSTRFGPEAIR